MATKKLPLQPISLRGDLKDFIYISMIEPQSSSFFVSFGISLLESLIRLKTYEELTHLTWEALIKYLELSKTPAEKFNLHSLHEKFRDLISQITQTSRKEALNLLCNTTESEDLLVIDYGIRFIIMSISGNASIIKGKLRNYDHMLNLLSQKLLINIFLVHQNKYKVMKSSNKSPLVCLYLSGPGNYSILYHRAAKYLDEKPDPVHIDPNNFPFTDSNAYVHDSSDTKNSVLDLINFLASNMPGLPPLLKMQLKHKIDAASIENPQILEITSLISLGNRYVCTHNSESVLSTCGKLHCRECIKTWDKCPCGYLVTFAEKERPSHSRADSNTRARMTKTSRFSIDSPILKEKSVCVECRKNAEREEFELVTCKDHKICTKCRAKRLAKGNNRCFQCFREYQVEEKTLLLAVYSGLKK